MHLFAAGHSITAKLIVLLSICCGHTLKPQQLIVFFSNSFSYLLLRIYKNRSKWYAVNTFFSTSVSESSLSPFLFVFFGLWWWLVAGLTYFSLGCQCVMMVNFLTQPVKLLRWPLNLVGYLHFNKIWTTKVSNNIMLNNFPIFF